MAPPPVKQDLDNHPLDEFLNDRQLLLEEIKKIIIQK